MPDAPEAAYTLEDFAPVADHPATRRYLVNKAPDLARATSIASAAPEVERSVLQGIVEARFTPGA